MLVGAGVGAVTAGDVANRLQVDGPQLVALIHRDPERAALGENGAAGLRQSGSMLAEFWATIEFSNVTDRPAELA